MRLGWVALPVLIAVPACSPVRNYQEAARSLQFTLDRVDPSLEVAFPLDQSRVVIDLTLGVSNPSTLPFHLRSFQGELRLAAADGLQPVGAVRLLRALDLPAGGKAELAVALSFTYQDLANRWPVIQAALRGGSSSWELDGTLRAEAYGIPLQLPVKTRRSFGAAP